MRRIVLTGKSRHGKNRIKETSRALPGWEGQWDVLQERPTVNFAPGVAGPWLYVAPAHLAAIDMERWIHGRDDQHFSVTMPPNVGVEPQTTAKPT